MPKKSRIVILILCAALAAGTVLFLTRDRSVLPLDQTAVWQIEFRIYPQDTPNFTLLDQARIGEIVEQINQLVRSEATERPDPMSDQYYLLRVFGADYDFQITVDQTHFSVKNEKYAADCTSLCALLEKTYQDHVAGRLVH